MKHKPSEGETYKEPIDYILRRSITYSNLKNFVISYQEGKQKRKRWNYYKFGAEYYLTKNLAVRYGIYGVYE